MSKTILLVDDDQDVIKYVSRILKKLDCEIISADNGEEGMSKINQFHPDLIILDVLMPKNNGINLFLDLKSTDTLKNIPVIILSGVSERSFLRAKEVQSKLKGQPAPRPDAFLDKPPDIEKITNTVKQLLGI